jgi:hypothetical protein
MGKKDKSKPGKVKEVDIDDLDGNAPRRTGYGIEPTRLPALDPNPGFKQTTVRLTQDQFDRIELFCTAVDESMVEFMRIAAEMRMDELKDDPRVKAGIERKIAHYTRIMETTMGGSKKKQ